MTTARIPVGCVLAASLTIAVGCDSADIEGDFNFENLIVRELDPALVVASFRLTTGEDNKDPVPYLKVDNFQFEEDERTITGQDAEAHIRMVQRRRAFRFDAVIMLDFSGSVAGDPTTRNRVIDGAIALTSSVAQEADVAVYYFDGRVDPVRIHDFGTPNPAASIAAFRDHVVVDSSTNLHGAIVKGVEVLDRRFESFKNTGEDEELFGGSLVIFTDGTHRAGEGNGYPSRREAREKVRDSDHAVFTVGVEGDVDDEFLRAIGRNGFVVARRASGDAALGTAFTEIAGEIDKFANSYYTVAFCSSRRAGDHDLTIRIPDWMGLSGRARLGFSANDFGAGCTRALIDDRYPSE